MRDYFVPRNDKIGKQKNRLSAVNNLEINLLFGLIFPAGDKSGYDHC